MAEKRIKGIYSTGLSVANLDAAVVHYEEQFGFECVSRSDMAQSGRNTKSALLRCPTGYLEIFEHEGRPEKTNTGEVYEAGIRHVCIQTKDANALYDKCMEAGASGHARPSGLGTGMLYAYIRDPEQNVLEIEGAPWAPEDEIKAWFAHTAIVTSDIDRLTKFYEELTGVKLHRKGSFGPHAVFDVVAGIEGVEFSGAWIKLGNATLEFWEYTKPRTEPVAKPRDERQIGWNQLCFEVENAQAFHDDLASKGVELVSSVQNDESGAFFFARDPDGNLFKCLELHASKKEMSIDALSGWSFLEKLEAATDRYYNRA